MASTLLGHALDPQTLTLLRITPLVSSTASLAYACSELITTSAFGGPARPRLPTTSSDLNAMEAEQAKEKTIPYWFVEFFKRGVWAVVSFNQISIWSGLANKLVVGKNEKYGTRSVHWYHWGVLFAVGHMLFVPRVMWQVKRLFELAGEKVVGTKGEEGGEEAETRLKEKFADASASEALASWLANHKVRMLVADAPAWLAFGFATVGSLTAV